MSQIRAARTTLTGICYWDWRTHKVSSISIYACIVPLTLELSMIAIVELVSVSSLMAY